jgi:CheY-like chemotaxis protein
MPWRRPSCGGYANMKISADPTTFRAKPVNCSILDDTGRALLDRNTSNPGNANDSGSVAMRVRAEFSAMAEFKLVAGPGRRPTNSERSFLRGCSILIVEDEPLIALDLHAALYAAGAGIIAATNAKEALRLIRRNEISAAVIDIRLGNQDSLEVCQALFHHRVPFLFYTAHADADLLKAWPEVPVLLKPAPSWEIAARIGELIH